MATAPSSPSPRKRVSHERLAPTLRVDEVEVVLQVETRGPAHTAHVTDSLRTAGYDLSFS